jgi:hypothetical protein
MNQPTRPNSSPPLILPCDGDPTIRIGDWLRLWNSGGGIAHDVWVGIGGVVYENSGPGGCVRRNLLSDVLARRQVIHIVARTAPSEFAAKVFLAERRVGTPWAAFYNCQDFASDVANGKPQSFQRDAALLTSAIFAGLALWGSQTEPPKKRRVRRGR